MGLCHQPSTGAEKEERIKKRKYYILALDMSNLRHNSVSKWEVSELEFAQQCSKEEEDV